MLSDYQTLVIDLVRDDAGKIVTAERDRAITAAVERYSKDRPRQTAEDLTPTSANVLPLPSTWVTDFSTLLSLEYPIGNVPRDLIEQDRYEFYRNTTAVVIQLLDAVAVAASNTRATYTIKHSVTTTVDTIPVGDREAVAGYAAAALCDELAALYSGGTDSTIQADSVEQKSKAADYSARAGRLRKRYFDEMGVDDKRNVATGVVVNLNAKDSMGGDRLLHTRVLR